MCIHIYIYVYSVCSTWSYLCTEFFGPLGDELSLAPGPEMDKLCLILQRNNTQNVSQIFLDWNNTSLDDFSIKMSYCSEGRYTTIDSYSVVKIIITPSWGTDGSYGGVWRGDGCYYPTRVCNLALHRAPPPQRRVKIPSPCCNRSWPKTKGKNAASFGLP